jgi:hypothetical protein
MSSWFSYGGSYVSRNVSISSSFTSLLQYTCLNYSHMIFYISLVSVLIFPFSSPYLLTCIFFFHHLLDLARVSSILLIFSKDQLSSSLICSILILLSNSLTSALIFIIPSHVLSFALICVCFLKV